MFGAKPEGRAKWSRFRSLEAQEAQRGTHQDPQTKVYETDKEGYRPRNQNPAHVS